MGMASCSTGEHFSLLFFFHFSLCCAELSVFPIFSANVSFAFSPFIFKFWIFLFLEINFSSLYTRSISRTSLEHACELRILIKSKFIAYAWYLISYICVRIWNVCEGNGNNFIIRWNAQMFGRRKEVGGGNRRVQSLMCLLGNYSLQFSHNKTATKSQYYIINPWCYNPFCIPFMSQPLLCRL